MAASTAQKKVNEGEDESSATLISSVHPDILLTHIFTRLNGPDLASASCASSHLRLISNQQSLWSDICHDTWPSTNDPRMHRLISNYPPDGPRSFFSDTFPLLVSGTDTDHPSPSPELISAVDLYYKNKCIFSKVQQTETLTSWFRCSPFRIDLLDPKHTIPTPIQSNRSFTCADLEEDLRLSWIVVDPAGQGRACNVSSRRAVSVQQHWLSGEIQLRFATVMDGGRRASAAKEHVLCNAVITCGEWGLRGDQRRIEVREVSLRCEDMEGTSLNGKESLEVLQRSMRFGRRSERGRRGDEGRDRYGEYLKKKEEREEKKVRREGRLDSICKAVGVGVVAAFCTFSLFYVLRY